MQAAAKSPHPASSCRSCRTTGHHLPISIALSLVSLLLLPSTGHAARSLFAPKFTESQLSDWMTVAWPTISSRQIQSVWMPGSHDTFTYDLGTTATAASCGSEALALANMAPVSGPVVTQWATSQVFNISTQLNNGVRYFDLRPYYRGNTNNPAQDIWIQHCVLTNSPLSTYLGQIASWLAAKPSNKEVVLLHFKDYTGTWDSTAYASLASVINQALGSYLVGSPSSTGAMTMSQIVGAGGPKVLAIMEPDNYTLAAAVPGANTLINYSSFMSRSWANTNSVSTLISMSNGYVANRPANQVLVLEGVITPQASDIASQLIVRGVTEMKSLLLYWEQGNLLTTNTLLNHTWATWANGPGFIVMLDNPHTVDNAFLISLNAPAKAMAPRPFTYGSCSASYQLLSLSCHTTSSSCITNYGSSNFYSGGICVCTCCLGPDCGCNRGQMQVCN